jgi:hypothetical protein
MRRAHVSNQLPAVLWIIQMDPEGETSFTKRCKHVNCIDDSATNVQGEKEYLFVPYSVFAVTKVEWSDNATPEQPHAIFLRAAIDNRAEPEDLPLSPWS